MNIRPYKLDTTDDLLTSRAGLLAPGQLMDKLNFAEHVDQHFPQPQSNRGFKPSEFIESFMLMQHEGRFHLDDIRHLQEDEGLRMVLGLDTIPKANTLGEWLRRMGKQPGIAEALVKVNQVLLQPALHNCKKVTLDIDATEIVAHKTGAEWTYNKNKGFMPMVGHIAETGQIVATDFRQGNVSPAQDNLGFIKYCQQCLPKNRIVGAMRIDAAGYQTNIIQYCDDTGIDYAIRAKTSKAMRAQIEAAKESDWQPFLDKQGEAVPGQDTYRTSFCIGDYENAFTLIIQRTAIQGQISLDLDAAEIHQGGYIYRAIATNRDKLSDSELIHWYNQRAEDSENRLKELKLDFGGDTLPCSDFKANALYFQITTLSYNLFALMRLLLPEELANHRAMTLRWRLYAMAAKVVRTGRQVLVKLKEAHRTLLEQVLMALQEFEPPPI